MARSALTGTRIRERRTLLGLKQADLARAVEISPSYLNLIEHNRRRIAGRLLAEIARALGADVAQLTRGAGAELVDQLGQAAADLPGAGAETGRIDEFTGRFPGWAALVRDQHRRIEQLQDRIEGLSDRLSHDPRLGSAMHEVLSKATAIRSAASILVETEDIDEAWQRRFHRNLQGDSLALAESAQALTAFLDGAGAARAEPATPWGELELFLERHRFHFPALEAGAPVAALLDDAAGMSAPGRSLTRAWLERYRREAALLPLDEVIAALERGQAAQARLGAARGLPVTLVLRRLASAPPVPGQDPVGLVVCEPGGAIALRKPASGFLVPRTGSACALWPLYEALGAPGRLVSRQLLHSSGSGNPVRAFAVAEPRWPFGAEGPCLSEGWMALLPQPGGDGAGALPVGSACRVCVLAECPARSEPSVMTPGL
ncbi:XRE family transcriptional regulator [Mangrovicoccus algicola]|uniref:Helix-turn-helix domain-containing protein n=1 Tax=Mangrovicoccus algicola TaxID=2771008 RepID=A0A8J6YWT5_9RHOB|nr:XRE family transcriptional regulator [Mangrovicoccus algicola]MBE3639197.1 helix-turn-helix domain-containing protein [Mangrovicoccus algicola]